MKADHPRSAAAVAALALVITLGLGNTARADSFAVLASSGSADVPPAARTAAIDALVSALRANNHRPTPPADVTRQLAAAHGAECAALDCAAGVIAALHVDGVIEIVLWSNGSGGVREIVVSIARANGSETSGTSPVGTAELSTAARAALTQALSANGGAAAAVHVVVRVSPRGAALTLDGRPLGQAPWEGTLPAGRHVLVAGHLGFVPERREIEPSTVPLEIAIELRRDPEADTATEDDAGYGSAPNDGAAHDGAARARTRRGRAVVGPIVLGSVGVALIAFDVAALVYAGGEPGAGFERTLDPLPFALYGAAGLGALTGAFLWWLFSGDSQPAPMHVALDLHRASFSLTF